MCDPGLVECKPLSIAVCETLSNALVKSNASIAAVSCLCCGVIMS